MSFQRREALLSTASLTAAVFLSDLSSLPAVAADVKTVRMHEYSEQNACHQHTYIDGALRSSWCRKTNAVTNAACMHTEVTQRHSGVCGWSVWEHRDKSCPGAEKEGLHSARSCAGGLPRCDMSSIMSTCNSLCWPCMHSSTGHAVGPLDSLSVAP